MAKAVLLEEFHIQVIAPSATSDRNRERIRRIVVSRRFRRQLQHVIRNLFSSRPELSDLVVRLGW